MKTQCPGCKAKFNINGQSVGKKTKCPKCAHPFTIEPLVETTVQSPAKNAEPVKTAEKLESKKLSKTVYVYCWAATQIIAGVFGLLGLMLALRKTANATLLATFAAGDVFLICSVVIELMLYYKMWSDIQDGKASVSPAKAVGFLFIPVFNIYWALCMITGFAEDYDAFIRRHSVTPKNLPLVLLLVYAVTFILSAMLVTIPFVCVFAFAGLIRKAFIVYHSLSWLLFSFALAAGIGHFITYILFAIKTCDAINALPGTSEGKTKP